jgi:thiol-disulfide isomerase/thioredoxin
MMRAFILSWLLSCSVLAAPPAKLDRLKVGSLTYTNVTIVSFSATDLYFSTDKGIKNVKLRLLDPETQKLFDYDPLAAAEKERKQSLDDAKYQSSVVARSVSSGARAAAQSANGNDKRRKSSEDNVADAISEQSPIGKPGPAIAAGKWSGSAPAPTLKGKFVLVTFWTPWSIPCQKWIPQFNALHKKFSDKLEVVGFVPESDADATDLKVEFPFAPDEKAKYQTALGVKSVPFVALMDPTGIILYEGHPAALGEKELKSLLARPPSDTR